MSDRPKLGLTTGRQAVIAVAAGALLCLIGLATLDALGQFPPVVPWSVAIVLTVLAISVVIYARSLSQRINERKVSPQESLAALSVGKSMLMTGASFAGAHVVYVMRFLQQIDAPLPSARVIQGIGAVIAALLLAGAGALLERACVVKGDDDDDQGGNETGEPEPA